MGHQLVERVHIPRTLAAAEKVVFPDTLCRQLAIAALDLAEVDGLEDAVSTDSAADSSETEDPLSAELE